MVKINPVIFLCFAVIILISGCMTSKGDLFTDTVTPSEEEQPEDDLTLEPGLTIHTYPYRCHVYINDNYAGLSPVREILESGNYRITVEKDGYYKTTEWVNYNEGDSVSIDIELEPITGVLRIESDNTGLKISTLWETLYPGDNELKIGRYLVEAELFGFEPWKQSVEIFENRTTQINIEMIPAVFNITNLFPTRKIFNPGNPAGLGKSNILFEVSSYGTGELEILSEAGDSILKHNFETFTKRDQSYSWDGKDSYGKNIPDGNYRIVVSGRDRKGDNESRRETWVRLDSSLIIRVRNIFSGISGTMFAPTPDILPKNSFQFALSGIGHIEENTGNYRFPVTLGTRSVPVENTEVNTLAGIFIQDPGTESYIFSFSAKRPFVNMGNIVGLKVSGTLKGTYLYNSYIDTMTNFTGLSGGVTSSVTAGPLSLIFAPEVTISPFYISYLETPKPGFYSWGYARCAIMADWGSTVASISAAFRSEPFSEGFSMDYPFSAGAELHWLIPGTGFFISGMVSGEFTTIDNYYINAGGGIGLIN